MNETIDRLSCVVGGHLSASTVFLLDKYEALFISIKEFLFYWSLVCSFLFFNTCN